jgi:hypothetical protein
MATEFLIDASSMLLGPSLHTTTVTPDYYFFRDASSSLLVCKGLGTEVEGEHENKQSRLGLLDMPCPYTKFVVSLI